MIYYIDLWTVAWLVQQLLPPPTVEKSEIHLVVVQSLRMDVSAGLQSTLEPQRSWFQCQ